MAIKPVEYVKNSSSQKLVQDYNATAGNSVPIQDDTAVPIQKDVNQGNTKPLDKGQEAYLNGKVNPDDVTYTSDEQKNVGASKINTTGEDGENLSEMDGKGGAATAVSAGSAAAGAAAVMTVLMLAKGIDKKAKAGEKFPGGMLPCGIIAAAGAAVALTCSFKNVFDPNLQERENQTNAAGDTDATMQSYIDTLNADVDAMSSESEEYSALIDEKTETDLDRIDEVTMLKSEMNVYMAQGQTDKAQQLQQQIDQINKGAEEDPIGEQLEETKGRMDEYDSHYNESLGVAESGSTVAKFLQAGDQMKNFAKAAKIASYVGVVACLVGVAYAAIRIGKDISKIFTAAFAAPDTAGLVCLVLAAGMMGYAAANFGKRMDSERAAGDAGDTMSEYVTNLNNNATSQAGFKETTSAGYDTADKDYEKTTTKANEDANKGLQKQQQQLAEIPTNMAEDDNKPSKDEEE